MFGLNKHMSTVKMHKNQRFELPTARQLITKKQGVGHVRKTTVNLKPNDQLTLERKEDKNVKGYFVL